MGQDADVPGRALAAVGESREARQRRGEGRGGGVDEELLRVVVAVVPGLDGDDDAEEEVVGVRGEERGEAVLEGVGRRHRVQVDVGDRRRRGEAQRHREGEPGGGRAVAGGPRARHRLANDELRIDGWDTIASGSCFYTLFVDLRASAASRRVVQRGGEITRTRKVMLPT